MAYPDASLDDKEELALGTLEGDAEEHWTVAEVSEPGVARSGTAEKLLEGRRRKRRRAAAAGKLRGPAGSIYRVDKVRSCSWQ